MSKKNREKREKKKREQVPDVKIPTMDTVRALYEVIRQHGYHPPDGAFILQFATTLLTRTILGMDKTACGKLSDLVMADVEKLKPSNPAEGEG